MQAIASVPEWIPEDDLLLKNAIEVLSPFQFYPSFSLETRSNFVSQAAGEIVYDSRP